MKKLIVRKMFAYAILLVFFASSIFLASCKNVAGGGVGSGGGGGSTPSQQQPQTLTFKFMNGNTEVGRTTTQDTSITFAAIKSKISNGNIQNPTPTNVGDTFEGWFYGTNNGIKADTNDDFTKSTTFTAKFTAQGQPAPQYQTLTFTFTAAGATPASKSVTKDVIKGSNTKVEFSDILSNVTTPQKTGYNFIGWFDGNIKVDASSNFTGDKTFTAKFEHTLRFTFTADGATPASQSASKEKVAEGASVTFAEIKTAGNIQNPTKANHVFAGWFDGNTRAEDTTTFTVDKTFTAKFTQDAAGSSGRTLTPSKPGTTPAKGDKVTSDGKIVPKNVTTDDGKVIGYIYKVDEKTKTAYAAGKRIVGTTASNGKYGINWGKSGQRSLNDDWTHLRNLESGYDGWANVLIDNPGALIANFPAIQFALCSGRVTDDSWSSKTNTDVKTYFEGASVQDRWYLPSEKELLDLYAAKDNLPDDIKNQLSGRKLWSATVSNTNGSKKSRVVDFTSGTASDVDRVSGENSDASDAVYAVAISKFKYN